MGAWLIMGLNGVLLGACCFLVANVVTQIGGAALEPSPLEPTLPRVAETRPDSRSAAPSAILERNLFGAQLAGDVQVASLRDEEPLVATKLPLRLLGTAAAVPDRRSRAAIEDEKTRKHMVVAIGDRLEGHPRVRVSGIERTRVILDNAGKPEELALHEDGPRARPRKPARPARQARQRPRQAARESLNDRLEKLAGEDGQGVSRILSSARIVPAYEQGKMVGMRVDAIKPDSVFERIGFENGDVITEVNGIVIDKLETTSEIFDEFNEADSITTAVRRGGATLTLSANTAQLTEQP